MKLVLQLKWSDGDDKWHLFGYSWNNIVDEVTALGLWADQTNAFAVGTSIELYRLNL